MGLDQYLYAKKFAHSGDWGKDEEKQLFASLVALSKIGEFMETDFPTAFIEVKVAQWRKANEIHQWFVDNCQDSTDDCRLAYVGREKLTELLDFCKQVVADNSKAQDLLPTQAGFFFGSTEYDVWYFRVLEETVGTLEKCLTLDDEWEFYYSSSW